MSARRWITTALALALAAAIGLAAWLTTSDATRPALDAVPLGASPDGTPGGDTSPSPSAVEEPRILLIADGAIVGWLDHTGWTRPDASGTVIPAVIGTTVRALDGTERTITEEPTATCFPEANYGGWRLDGFVGLHVSGTHELQPRAIRNRTPRPADEETVRGVLEELAVVADVVIRAVHVVDLDGDDKDEAIIVASNVPDGEALHGLSSDHYSVVVMRRLRADDSVEVVPIHFENAPGEDAGANSITLMNVTEIVDVTGDGRYEVLMSYAGYEWGGVTLYDLTTPTPTELVGAGCGA